MEMRAHQPGGNHPARVGLRLSPEAKQIVEQAAALLGMTVNAFATAQVVERSQQVLRETHGLILDNKAREKFLAMLDNPEGPNDALKAAAERYKKGKVSGDRYIFKA